MNGNRQWILRARPEGAVGPAHFEIRTVARPQPGPGEVLVRHLYLLVPPSMRLWMDARDSYLPAQPLGEVMMGITLGVVEASNVPALPVGTFVNGMGGCQEWAVAAPDQLAVVAPHAAIPLAAYRSVLDVQGLTAYAGLTEIGRPKAGETLVVTAAAGSVGSMVCQIGRELGLHVVGIAGGAEKCAWLRDTCGVEAIDYKADDVAARLDTLCPRGIDIVFENVGGPVMALLLERLNRHARVALCGLVASYNGAGGDLPASALMRLVIQSARVEGFLVRDHLDRYADVIARLQDWVLDGRLHYQLDVLDGGLEQLAPALGRLFRGENRGVQLLRLGEENTR